MIKNGKIFSVCDVPLTTCDSIYVIGDQDYQIAVILEKDKRKACAISTNTFEVSLRIKDQNFSSSVLLDFVFLSQNLGDQDLE